MDRMDFESLIFDIDGTLWDSREVIARGYNAQLTEEGLERFFVDAELLKTVFGKTSTEIADIIFEGLAPEIKYPLIERCIKRGGESLREDVSSMSYPNVKETLEQLVKNHRLFIVSNSQSGYPQLCIEKMGLEGLIIDHLCFGDTGTPKGETIRRLMQRNGIENAVYIGDTQGDLEATELAGIPFVYCTFGFGNPTHYWKKIDSFEELLEL